MTRAAPFAAIRACVFDAYGTLFDVGAAVRRCEAESGQGLGPLAADFCKIIRTAGGKKFVIGTTSGCAYPGAGGKPNIPWKEFFAASDILLPQTYWRWTYKGKVSDINGGTPAKSIKRGMAAWQPKSQVTPILPMLGEADVVTPQEITNYGNELAGWKVSEGHFYTDNGNIPVPNLAAMQAL